MVKIIKTHNTKTDTEQHIKPVKKNKKKSFRWDILILIILFIGVFSTRLFFALSEKEFSNDESYFALRQIESLKESKTFIYNDKLSFGGKSNPVLPFYYVLLSIFSMFYPAFLVGKILPNLFISSTVFISYLIFKTTTKNKTYSIIGAVVTSFIPVFFSETLNIISVDSLLIPLICLLILCFLNLEKSVYIKIYVAVAVITAFLSSKIFIFILPLFLYLLLLKIKKIKQEKKEIELMLFTVFFSLWVTFLFYKKALMFHGMSFVAQNIPQQLLNQFFSELTIIDAVYKIGILPLLAGVYMVYKGVANNNKKEIFLSSFSISTTLLLWFKLIPLKLGLMLLGVSLSLFFAVFLKNSDEFLKKTKFSKTRPLFFFLISLLIIFTLFVPSISSSNTIMENTPKPEIIDALNWFKLNSDDNSTLVSLYNEGNKIAYFTKRKNVIDSNFFLVEDITQRYKDIERIYKTKSEIEAIRLMEKYHATHILLTEKSKEYLGIDELDYVKQSKCFPLLYDYSTQIYKLECTLENE